MWPDCSNNGQYESLYHGVPMIGFPAFAEQHHNARRAEAKNFSITMNIKSFKSDELVRAINTVIGSNTKESVYTRNAKIAQEKLQSRPVTPQDKVAYWVDYVIKYGGHDLRSHALEIGTVEFLMIDLIAFIIGIFLTFILVCLLCGKYCFNFCRRSNKAKKE